jgi:hypothetical protein
MDTAWRNSLHDGDCSEKLRIHFLQTTAVKCFLNEGNARNIFGVQRIAVFRKHGFDGFDIRLEALAGSALEEAAISAFAAVLAPSPAGRRLEKRWATKSARTPDGTFEVVNGRTGSAGQRLPAATYSKHQPLEIDTRVDDKTARPRGACDASKVCIVHIDVRTSENGMVQHADRIQPEFELFRFVDLETFDEVHVEIQDTGALDCRVTERSHLARLRIHENDLAVGRDQRFIAEAAVQSIQR